ncbi:MAG: SMP-30/gluconolactonase/LRE family protein [Planctomycetota bacterium]
MRTAIVIVAALALVVAGCGPKLTLQPPAVSVAALELPEGHNTPDGMAVDADGNILLSVLNVNDPTHPAKIMKIDKNDRFAELCTLPGNPLTKKHAAPLGIAIGSDGHLYVADNQSFYTADMTSSRLLRVVLKGGKAERVETVATGMYMPNAVVCRGDSIYVTESQFDPKASPMPSGIYRFKIAELKADQPIAVKPGGKDPHVVARLMTQNTDWVGANGMGLGADGSLYVCNFGDARLERFVLDDAGEVVRHEVVAEGQGMQSCDGLEVDPETGHVYIADFLGNALHRVDVKTGAVTTLVQNGNTDGGGGLLDRPSEPCVRGSRVYVANIDLPLAGNEFDPPHTLSVIELTR